MGLLKAARNGLSDFLAGLRMLNTASHFAYTETISRYRRSVLGPLWLVLGTAVGVLGLGFVWSTIFGLEKKIYLPMLCVGIVIWQFISSSLIESSANFTRNSQTLLNIKTPNWFFTTQLIIKNSINLFHSLIIIVFVLVLYPPELYSETWKALLGLCLLLLNLMWVSHILAYIGARYRDTEPLVSAVMPLVFFLTPVIYRSQNFEGLANFVYLNPISHVIDSIREPLLGHHMAINVYLNIFLVAIVGWLMAFVVTGCLRKKLAYWL